MIIRKRFEKRKLNADYARNTKELMATKYYDAGHGSRAVACFLFARSEAVTVGSNLTQGMNV
jgi:hypothetical protein